MSEGFLGKIKKKNDTTFIYIFLEIAVKKNNKFLIIL
jgi:hypothetical protein